MPMHTHTRTLKLKTVSLIAAGLCALLAGSGCSSTSLPKLAGAAAYTGTRWHLIDNPQDLPKFETALASLNALEASGDFDPIAFAAVLRTLPIKELRNDKAALAIESAIVLYEAELAETVEIDRPELVKKVLPRVRSGIEKALTQSR